MQRIVIRATWILISIAVILSAGLAMAQDPTEDPTEDPPESPVGIAPADSAEAALEKFGDALSKDQIRLVRQALKGTGVIWIGNDRHMTFSELASYCAPVLWFSPDEPLLDKKKGRDIRVPTSFPFQDTPDAPVGYYRVRTLLVRAEADGPAIVKADELRHDTTIDLEQISGIDLDYFFYYPWEKGLGAHEHDVESTQFKLVVIRNRLLGGEGYSIVAQRVIGKAHGILWYDNTLQIDEGAVFPMHILVEEGKHASCTDKNGDGYYSPGYDVNKRVNDAWGVRDIMSSGSLYTGGFMAWMAKVRPPAYRVFPPLPPDSPLRAEFSVDGVYAPDNAIYEVRPFPRSDEIVDDPHLVPFIADKGSEDWPEEVENSDLRKLGRWMDEESFIKSLSVSFRYDGDMGISFVFPLLIVKNVADPIGGGWFVNRIYFKDKGLRDFAWNILYTTSASRWIDGYFAAGWEWDSDGSGTEARFMTETGIKLRFNIGHSAVSFLSKLTDFWGLRMGIKAYEFAPFTEIGYVIEVGAGTF